MSKTRKGTFFEVTRGKVALSQLSESLINVGDQYQVEVPWKGKPPVLRNNYETSLRRLKKTEKRLLKYESLGTD